MSIAVAVHAGRYVLLAADCLEYTYTDETLTTIAREWRRRKLARTASGLLTGTGASRLIDAVADAMRHRAVDDPRACILEERRKTQAWPDALRTHAATSTGFLFTYTPAARAIGAGVYHPHFSDRDCFDVVPGRILAFMRDRSYERYADALERAVQICWPDDDLEQSLQYHADLVRALIHDYAAEPHPVVSAECQLGVHHDDGRCALTEILAPGDPLVWSAGAGDRLTHVA